MLSPALAVISLFLFVVGAVVPVCIALPVGGYLLLASCLVVGRLVLYVRPHVGGVPRGVDVCGSIQLGGVVPLVLGLGPPIARLF